MERRPARRGGNVAGVMGGKWDGGGQMRTCSMSSSFMSLGLRSLWFTSAATLVSSHAPSGAAAAARACDSTPRAWFSSASIETFDGAGAVGAAAAARAGAAGARVPLSSASISAKSASRSISSEPPVRPASLRMESRSELSPASNAFKSSSASIARGATNDGL
jgi:hypothetical protein